MAISGATIGRKTIRVAKPRAVLSPIGGLFSYVWRNSRREQLVILAIVLVSLPFYYVSLDVPKSIVNDAIQGHAFRHAREHAPLFRLAVSLPAWLGGRSLTLLPGVELSRLPYLLALSFAFLGLTLVNGGFKYVINMRKGKLGERVLQRLRFDLFALLLRFTPEAMRNVKASEIATIIKDEVEPIGSFVGDAFVQPVFLGGQAATALVFIVLQSPLLGGIAFFMVAIQGVVIPRLRREQLRLGKERQLRSRALAGRIGEVVDGMPEVENHGIFAYERARIAAQLEQLFRIRYRLYGRKFLVKFINNLLAQITPFMFYSVGGYLALRGMLDIGQLVAVIAAYRDLPPPVKELIDWDQQRLDVEIKYAQVVEQFSGSRTTPPADAVLPPLRDGIIDVQGLRVTGSGGEVLLDGVNAEIRLGRQTALLAETGDGASLLAQVLGRRILDYAGTVRVGGLDLATLDGVAAGAQMAYAGPAPVIFAGTVRDNVLYGLRRHAHPDAWIDFAAAGAAGADDIDTQVIRALRIVGLDDAIYRFGLSRTIDPHDRPDLALRFVAARHAVRRALNEEGAQDLIETFERGRFNRNASIGENLVFGLMPGGDLDGQEIGETPLTHQVLERNGLRPPLATIGLKIAQFAVELFSGLSPKHFLFEQFSIVPRAELPAYEEIVSRAKAGPSPVQTAADHGRLVALALRYVEPRHRLGLLTQDIVDQVLSARRDFIAAAPQALGQAFEFYDPDRYCAAAPLRDNLLFGRVAFAKASAEEQVLKLARRVLEQMGLDHEVHRLGLDQPTGTGGRLLFPSQCSAIGMARCLIKRPQIFIFNEAAASFGEVGARVVLEDIRAEMQGRTLLVVTRDVEVAADFDQVIAFSGPRVQETTPVPDAVRDDDVAPRGSDPTEYQSLRAVPIFADIDAGRLKLIAFTSERVTFATGEVVFRQGDASDFVLVVVGGAMDVLLETGSGRLPLARVGAGGILGEMGVIDGSPRSATVIAREETTALRLSRDVLLGLVDEFPQIARSLMRAQIRRTRAAEARLAASSASRRP